MTTAMLFILLFLCMFLGMPIAVALGLSSIATILLFSTTRHPQHQQGDPLPEQISVFVPG